MLISNFTNNTNSTEPPTVGSVSWIEQYEEPKALYIFRLTLFSVIISASIIGNSMVCYAVCTIPSRKPLSYHLVANMAFAEILSSVCLAVMFASWQPSLTDTDLQKAACILNPLQVVALLVVIYSLAAIAFYRYRFIVKPLPRTPSSVKKITILTISGLWLLSFAIACPFFFGLRFRNGKCEELSFVNDKSYVAIRFILNYALPYVIMLASYGAVAWNLKMRIVRINERNRTSTAESSCVVQIEDQTELQDLGEDTRMKERKSIVFDQNNRRDSKPENTDPEKDLLKMIFVLIIIYVVCYFPYQAHYVWERVRNITVYQFRYHQLFIDYNFILICLPSALHPLCYGTMNSFFAKAFSKIILCRSYE
nr:D(2)-like dopamine receptor [Pocillopora verrucosa]XP_058961968.1 D(2)-like dopamine receptor [Pocillopora verrucosa]